MEMETNVVIDYCYENRTDHEEPVDHGNVKLAMEGFGRVDYFNLWEIGQFHNLCKELWKISMGSENVLSADLPGKLL